MAATSFIRTTLETQAKQASRTSEALCSSRSRSPGGVHLARLLSTLAALALTLPAFLLVLAVLFNSAPPRAHAQKLIHYTHRPNAADGAVIYNNGCIACHGAQGNGAPKADTVFLRPDTFPDFTDCAGTTPEPDSDWKAIILHGGPFRGFSQIMPAFGQMLSDQQIDDVIAYLRSFCHNVHHYPRGELNLPRALVTEKAFPEDEFVVTSALGASDPATNTTDFIHEETFAGRTQLEVDVPVSHADINHNGTTGFGDITVGLKREIFSSLRAGSILSLQGGVLLPTGDSRRGFGAGATTFEPFAAFDQLLPENTSLQFQLGADIPTSTANTPRSLFFRTAIGQPFAQDHGLGRLYVPMVELLANRDYQPGAVTDWDILPQLQVTISPRQHVRAAVGYREPFTDTTGRQAQVSFYVLWDWADGKLWSGW